VEKSIYKLLNENQMGKRISYKRLYENERNMKEELEERLTKEREKVKWWAFNVVFGAVLLVIWLIILFG